MENIEEKVKTIVYEIMEVEPDELGVEDYFETSDSIEWDSLKALDIIASLEKEFKVRINEADIKEMSSIKKIVEVMNNLMVAS